MRRIFYNDPGHAHFLTFSCYHKHQFLTDNRVRQWLGESIDNARERHRFALLAYMLMPEHVHMLVYPRLAEYSMSTILRAIKQPVAARLVRRWRMESPSKLAKIECHQGRRIVHRVWQAGGGYDRNMTDWKAIASAADYIEWNPVRRGLVEEPVDWVWSSARARQGFADTPFSIDSVGELRVAQHC